MAEISDHYQTLDVPEMASAAEIKRAYRRLARAFHPDRNGSDPVAPERFRAIQEAYEVLAHPGKRAAYDRLRRGPFSEIEREVVASRGRPDTEAEVRLSFSDSLSGGTAEVRLRNGVMLTIPIPQGIRSGAKVRFRGQAPARSGHEAGDLYVTFRVAPSPRFRREGNDLHIIESVSVMEAMLGTTRAIANAYGRGIKVTIPPGTQPGERLRLRGQGVRTATQKGDLYVEIRVTVPRSLTEDQRAALAACVRELGIV